jgi:hypothetical protein
MAALNRFISRLGERGLPFFKLLKCQDKLQWMEEVEQALQDLQHHLQSPPILTTPLPIEDLLLYIAVTTHVVSSAIVVEHSEEGHAFGVERPMYFISEVLSKSKGTIPGSSETLICNSDYIEKVAPLLRRVQDYCDYGFSVGGYSP